MNPKTPSPDTPSQPSPATTNSSGLTRHKDPSPQTGPAPGIDPLEGPVLKPRLHTLPLLSVQGTRDAENAAYAGMESFTLMARAGEAAWDWARQTCGSDPRAWLILAGTGNNGGDAFVLARHAHAAGLAVAVYATGPSSDAAHDAARARRELESAGVTVHPASDLLAIHPSNWACIIDGLLGIGVRSDPTGEAARVIAMINAAAHPLTLALDVPSGLNADTGAAPACCVRASHTLTFIAAKPGLLTADGPDHAGQLSVATLGLSINSTVKAPADADILSHWPKRSLNSHKGAHGDVVIIGGDAGMTGAAILAARAAVQMGAGRVFAGLLDGPQMPGYDPMQPEIMLRTSDALMRQGGVWVIGPGAGQSERMQALLRNLLRLWHDEPSAAPSGLVLDADALNLIAADPSLAIRVQTLPLLRIITPHPLEAGRLLNRSAAAIQSDRLGSAQALARQLDAVVILKGMGSIVTDGQHSAINLSGGPALASGGTGDVLAGTVGALLAQCLNALPRSAQQTDLSAMLRDMNRSAWDAALLATHLHGASCDRQGPETAAPVLLTASELPQRMRAHLSNRIPAR